MPDGDSRTDLYRLVEAPEPSFEPQIGWVYEMRPTSGSRLKLRLVELPDGTRPDSIFEIGMHVSDVSRYFEAVQRP